MDRGDDCFGPGAIRAYGRKLHPAFLWVKKPAESKAPWDYYKLLATTSAAQAFRPIDNGAENRNSDFPRGPLRAKSLSCTDAPCRIALTRGAGNRCVF